jgi:hypothetical protein
LRDHGQEVDVWEQDFPLEHQNEEAFSREHSKQANLRRRVGSLDSRQARDADLEGAQQTRSVGHTKAHSSEWVLLMHKQPKRKKAHSIRVGFLLAESKLSFAELEASGECFLFLQATET